MCRHISIVSLRVVVLYSFFVKSIQGTYARLFREVYVCLSVCVRVCMFWSEPCRSACHAVSVSNQVRASVTAMIGTDSRLFLFTLHVSSQTSVWLLFLFSSHIFMSSLRVMSSF